MRIFARDAGDSNVTASGARARIEDTLTITGPQGGAPVMATLRMRAEAYLDTLTNRTGGPVGGEANTQFWGELSVSAERRPVFNRAPVEHRGFVGFRHLAGHGFVRGENDSTIEEAIPSGPTILERGRITPTRFRGGTPSANPVQATRLGFERNAVGTVAALMEIDFLASPGDTFGVRGFIDGMATGAPGHGATVDGENTGRMFLDLPESYGFTPATEGFLANQSPLGSPTPVPVPGSGLLMAGAVGALLLARRRRG